MIHKYRHQPFKSVKAVYCCALKLARTEASSSKLQRQENACKLTSVQVGEEYSYLHPGLTNTFKHTDDALHDRSVDYTGA
jgi:hypothetical protein